MEDVVTLLDTKLTNASRPLPNTADDGKLLAVQPLTDVVLQMPEYLRTTAFSGSCPRLTPKLSDREYP